VGYCSPDAPNARYDRTWSADWWVFVVLLVLFGAVATYGRL
jgi:hypothetical protein